MGISKCLSRYYLCLGLLSMMSLQPVQGSELTLAVADSACTTMKAVVARYNSISQTRFNYLCKSSGLLAKGINGGALSADIFISADQEWMDFAIENGLIAKNQVLSPWGNVLVVATAKNSSLQLGSWQELASDKVATILIGDPSTAPFGRYAKQALETTGIWDRVKRKIVTRKNISLLAESLASANPDTVGILFKTHLDSRTREIFEVDKRLHSPIRYYVAPLKASAMQPEAAKFIKYLQSRTAEATFEAEGFSIPPD